MKKLKLIGIGAFGRVWAVTIDQYEVNSKSKITPQCEEMVYALKEMNKSMMVAKGALRIANNEVKILKAIPKSDFIVNVWDTFQDEHNAYVLMDYAPCGDLLFHMKRLKSKMLTGYEKGGTFSEYEAKFIVVWILEALRTIHKSGIIHRDVKPDNIIIDANGYAKLADFGIADYKDNIIPWGQFGTLSYMAPEIIFEHKYSYTVDYYSLGVLLLLLVTGDMLSVGKTTKEAKKAIALRKDSITTKKFVKRYSMISQEWCDIIVKLLTTSQLQRIGSKNGVDEILAHEWFEDIDLKAIQNQTLDSPIFDIVASKESISKLVTTTASRSEETYFWMKQEKKAMRMISRSLVDYGDYWIQNFPAFKYLDVNTYHEVLSPELSENLIKRHTLASIERKRKQSLSQTWLKRNVSLIPHQSDTTRLSDNRTGAIDHSYMTPVSFRKLKDYSLVDSGDVEEKYKQSPSPFQSPEAPISD